MSITETLVLPDDVMITKVGALAPGLRDKFDADEGDYVITRPRSRSPSTVVDEGTAALLREFKAPSTVAEALLRYSVPRRLDPEATLNEAFPLLKEWLGSSILIPAGEAEEHALKPSFAPGDAACGATVVALVHLLSDTEIYQAKRDDGAFVAIKLARRSAAPRMNAVLRREAEIHRALQGATTPHLFEEGMIGERYYLQITWCPGAPAEQVLAAARGTKHFLDQRAFAASIVEAYAAIHERGVVHGDVHPGNVLIGAGGEAWIIDLGYARRVASERVPRAGVGFFYEPEFARAAIEGREAPQATFAGEQHAVAALLYQLLTGAHYLDISLESGEMMRRIAERPPLSFSAQGCLPWPSMEAALGRALSKDPCDRFPDMRAFAAAIRGAALPESAPLPRRLEAASALYDDVLTRAQKGGDLFEGGFAEAPYSSVNMGAAGLAYMLYRASLLRSDPGLIALADLWAHRAEARATEERAFYDGDEMTEESLGAVSPYHTMSGVWAVRALVASALAETTVATLAKEAFVASGSAPCERGDLTLGKAGVALAALELHVASPSSDLLTFAEAKLGEAESLHTSMDYLGIAHGEAGLLYTALRLAEAKGGALSDDHVTRLDALAARAEPMGRGVRYRRRAGVSGREAMGDYVPGWCNGGAGMVFLWLAAARVTGQSRWVEEAIRAGYGASDHPDNYGDLCCGLGGRAYSLLALGRATGDARYFDRARELADRAATSIRVKAFRRDSLFKGEIGVALLAAEIESPELARMPLFEGP